MGRNAIETILGAVVLMLAALFMVFAYTSADLQKVKGYEITANFPMVDGVKEGSDVRINGVKIGSVSKMALITESGKDQYRVAVRMTVLPEVEIPTDTIAMIASESLLGGKYMALEIGVEDTMLPRDGSGKITNTQAPMRLDDLIGQMIYSKKADAAPAAPAASSPAAPAMHAPAATHP